MNTSNSSDYFTWRLNTNQKLLIYSNFTFIPIGILFNLIQCLIFFRKNLIGTTMSVYYIVMSINNIFMLSATALRFVTKIEIYNFKEESKLGCKLAGFSIRYAFHGSSWLKFLASLDRLLFILFPNRFKYIQNKKGIFLILLGTYAFLFLLNIPSLLFEYYEDYDKTTNKTINMCVGSKELSIIRELLSQIVGVLIPLILMFSTNIVLIRRVIESKKKFETISHDINFAFPLIISNILFVITILPFSVFLIILMRVIIDPGILIDPDLASFFALYETCSLICVLYDFGFSLIVHIIFNRLIRKEFFEMFLNLKKSFFNP